MSDNVQKLAELGTKALEELGNWVSSTKDFATEQAPMFCQEIVRRGQIYHGVWIAACVAILAVYIVWIWTLRRNWTKWTGAIYDGEMVCGMFGVGLPSLAAIAATIGLFDKIYKLAYITYCPRLYIVEQIMKLAKDIL